LRQTHLHVQRRAARAHLQRLRQRDQVRIALRLQLGHACQQLDHVPDIRRVLRVIGHGLRSHHHVIAELDAARGALYGLEGVTEESPVEYETVEMTAPTNLALIADLTDAPVSYLFELNPALLRSVAPAGYSLRVPKSTATTLIAGLDSIPGDHRLGWRMHRVETGETLAAIAKRYGATAGSILSANHMLSTDQPAPGDRLIIPAAYREPPAPKAAVKRSARTRPRTAGQRSTASAGQPAATKSAAPKPVAAAPVHKTSGTVAAVRKPQPKL